LGFIVGTSVAIAYAAGGIDMFADVFIDGTLTVQDGTQGFGKVFTSDGAGTGSWQTIPADGDSDPTNELQTLIHVVRFNAGNEQTINVNPLFFVDGNTEGSPLNGFLDFRRGATLVGVDGEITELRYDIGAGVLNGFTSTVSLWKNNVIIGSCSVVTTNIATSCVDSLSEPVSAGDLIAVSHVSPAGSVSVQFFHASVVVEGT